MFKRVASVVTVAVILAFNMSGKPVAPSGSWHIDARHSDAQLSTDGTTDFGKTKMHFTVGFTRVNGTMTLNPAVLADSRFDFQMYPADSMAPPIDEEGKFKIEWFANYANDILVSFHSKGATQTSDGRLQTTGNLVLTRVDRNVELTPSEAYAGPVYGPPMIHRIPREATFVFDSPSGSSSQKDESILISGSTKVIGEDFPQLVKSVIATYWPPVVQDKNCEVPVSIGGEGYSGSQCTGTFLMASPLPEAPHATGGEDYPGPPGFNAAVGGRLDIVVRLRLTPAVSGAQMGGGY